VTNPRFPVYIPSKGRHETRTTMRYLDHMHVPYTVVVEEQEYDNYAAVIPEDRLLILDEAYKRGYETCDDWDPARSKGSGPARNFIWQHAMASGAPWHWIMDDNISGFYRVNRNTKYQVMDGTIFRCMEDFVLRYENVAMAGPNYDFFVPKKDRKAPFTLNTRIFSCNLIRCDLPFRWRARYNEDLDLSLRMLKAGLCTVLFNAFLQKKIQTQVTKGGNTTALYGNGTLAKSRMIVALHPDVCRLTWRYGRYHHHCDFSPFKVNKLIRRADLDIQAGSNEYGMTIQPRDRIPANIRRKAA
jgi:hypothetical protein